MFLDIVDLTPRKAPNQPSLVPLELFGSCVEFALLRAGVSLLPTASCFPRFASLSVAVDSRLLVLLCFAFSSVSVRCFPRLVRVRNAQAGRFSLCPAPNGSMGRQTAEREQC